MIKHDDDLTEPQYEAITTVTREAVKDHVTSSLTKVWRSLLGLGAIIIGQGLYIAYETGLHIRQQDQNTTNISQLVTERNTDLQTRVNDEIQLSSMNATLTQMQGQLSRIEAKEPQP